MELTILNELIEQGLSTHQMAKELDCSQSNVRHWLKKYGLNTNVTKQSPDGVCTVCKTPLSKQQVMFCSPACKLKKHHQRKKEENPNTSYSQLYRGADRKAMLIMEKGGSCATCGYKKNIGALHFHHVNDKSFSLDMRTMGNLSLERIREEADKCIVLCSNCHAEEHYPHLENWENLLVNKAEEKINHLKTKAEKVEASKNYCICGIEIAYGSKQCKSCLSATRRANRPSIEQLQADRQTMTFAQMGEKYGVTGNAVKKWMSK